MLLREAPERLGRILVAIIRDVLKEKGPQGERGETGEPGMQGVPGPSGERGAIGPEGPQGVKGYRGDKGERGERGFQGITGATGPQGYRGERGERGLQGDKGYPGNDGKSVEKEEVVAEVMKKIPVRTVEVPQFIFGGGGGSKVIEIWDDTGRIGQDIRKIIFAGAGIVASRVGDGVAVVTVSGGGSGSNLTEETPTGTVDGSNNVYHVDNAPLYIVVDNGYRPLVLDITELDGNGFIYDAGTGNITVSDLNPPTKFIRAYYNA